MEGAIVSKLRGTSGVSAIVGQRVWPGRRPQARTLPSITVFRVDGAPIYTNDGETGLAEGRVQIDCWATTYTDAKNAAGAVKDALSNFEGTQSGTTFRLTYVIDERDTEEGGSNQDTYYYRTSIDIMVMFEN